VTRCCGAVNGSQTSAVSIRNDDAALCPVAMPDSGDMRFVARAALSAIAAPRVFFLPRRTSAGRELAGALGFLSRVFC
jgi:hypothetical protein